MERWVLKLICSAVSLFVSVICTLLPYKMSALKCRKKKGKKNKKNSGETNKRSDRETSDKLEYKIASITVGSDAGNGSEGNGTTHGNNGLFMDGEGHLDATEPLREGDKAQNDAQNRVVDQSEESEEENEEDEEVEAAKLRIMMCFGGGVFMGTFLLHILPEVKELLETHLMTPNLITYPVPEVLIGAGFFLMLFVDLIVVGMRKVCGKRKDSEIGVENGVGGRDGIVDEGSSITAPNGYIEIASNTGSTTKAITTQRQNYQSANENPSNPHHSSPSNTPPSKQSYTYHPDHKLNPSPNHHLDPSLNPPLNHPNDQRSINYQKTTRSLVLILALSLHHIFEGLSIGLQKEFSNVWHLTLAVLVHETAICFSVGLQFFKLNKKLTCPTLLILATASSIMPIGILMGTAVSEVNSGGEGGDRNILNGVLQALACGTFIYVTFFEIIFENLLFKESNESLKKHDVKEEDPEQNPSFHSHSHASGNQREVLYRHMALFCGFVFMALLALIPESSSHH